MGWLWLGLVLGLLVGAGVVALVIRAVGRLTGTGLRSVGRLIVDGLTPGRRREGVAAQRALARRLKRAGDRTASGRRVAAEELTVHISPEDHEVIDEALGIEAAQTDLVEFYRGLASRGGWLVGAEPQVRIVRDISLRPRQAFVRTVTRAAPAPSSPPSPLLREEQPPQPPAPEPRPFARPPVAQRPDDAVTDVLPRSMLQEADRNDTAVYPASLGLGDLVVVHGTDVRTVSPADGALRLGRGRHNDLVLDRPGVGRDHLLIEARGDAWWVVPGTAPGATLLDGAPLDAPTAIGGGAVLELGRGVRVRLSVEAA
jgi:hypothetical protein